MINMDLQTGPVVISNRKLGVVTHIWNPNTQS